MEKRMLKVIALSCAVAFAAPASASSLAEWLGLDKIAHDAGEKAGTEAATKLVHGMDLATRNLVMMTNQFGLLVSDLDSPDPAIAAHARKTLQRVLGNDAVTGTKAVPLQVSAAFENVPAEANLQVDILRFASLDDAAALHVIGDTASLKMNGVNVAQQDPATIATLQTAVTSGAADYVARFNPEFNSVGGYGPFSSGQRAALDKSALDQCGQFVSLEAITCNRRVKENAAKNELAALLLTPYKALGTTTPVNAAVTRNLPGGTYALVIASEAGIRAAPNLTMSTWVHAAGDLNAALGDFKNSKNRYVADDFLKRCVESNLTTVGKVCYIWVNLNLDDIMNYTPLTVPTPKAS
jgi:hypothetical protein